ncbi:hypothetical protein DUNSADRAFT_11718 [Dunaliella salina]|uniref:Uncharacterized protein n=1 Tax=Dunaliella salina TaxID=3046 RepID=A0ABQ7GCT2_DUNSA|nr:hypothetical protein DUNSADRAFT_11718 [Dunaliella salina]|eukprot:KAF5832416.1 hypothetical protein DUNSADRAFT_11718 [Dunaliella salina]
MQANNTSGNHGKTTATDWKILTDRVPLQLLDLQHIYRKKLSYDYEGRRTMCESLRHWMLVPEGKAIS